MKREFTADCVLAGDVPRTVRMWLKSLLLSDGWLSRPGNGKLFKVTLIVQGLNS